MVFFLSLSSPHDLCKLVKSPTGKVAEEKAICCRSKRKSRRNRKSREPECGLRPPWIWLPSRPPPPCKKGILNRAGVCPSERARLAVEGRRGQDFLRGRGAREKTVKTFSLLRRRMKEELESQDGKRKRGGRKSFFLSAWWSLDLCFLFGRVAFPLS